MNCTHYFKSCSHRCCKYPPTHTHTLNSSLLNLPVVPWGKTSTQSLITPRQSGANFLSPRAAHGLGLVRGGGGGGETHTHKSHRSQRNRHHYEHSQAVQGTSQENSRTLGPPEVVQQLPASSQSEAVLGEGCSNPPNPPNLPILQFLVSREGTPVVVHVHTCAYHAASCSCGAAQLLCLCSMAMRVCFLTHPPLPCGSQLKFSVSSL